MGALNTSASAVAAAFALLLLQSHAAKAESVGRCQEYAKSAIADYDQMQNIKKCNRKSDVRWHNKYDTHYNWCLKAKRDWLFDETKKRDAYLLSCGGRSKL